MRVWNAIKDFFTSLDQIMEKMKTCKNLARLLRKTAALIVIFVLFLQYWNVLKFSSLEAVPRFDKIYRDFLKNNILTCIWLWIIYSFLAEKVLLNLTIWIESKIHKNILPVWFTIDDCIDFSLSIFFIFYGMNLLVEFSNGVSLNIYTNSVYIVATWYLMVIFIRWIYNQNNNMWSEIRREYTQFYDSEGRRIPKDAYVVYYGKLYKVYLGRKSGGSDKTREWKISSDSNIFKDNFSLEEAIRDKAGHLVLEQSYR